MLFRPLPLQLVEQIGGQQAIPHQATGQRAVHHLSRRCSLTSGRVTGVVDFAVRTRGCLIPPAALGLRWANGGCVCGSDETCDVSDPLLDDVVKIPLDLSHQCGVWEHVHETVATETDRHTKALVTMKMVPSSWHTVKR